MRASLDATTDRLSEMGRAGYARVCAMHDARENARTLQRLFERYGA
jgi:hypothetical protein